MTLAPTPSPSPTGPGPSPVQRVRGTHDFLPPIEARLRLLETQLRATFESFGYQGVQTPILEPLELFLRKSGDEIAARMYAFSHWNRRLCLRPDITASVMRAYVAELQGRSLPVRLHYSGPTFRYERPSRGRDRQFTQVGVELIGGAGAAADAEVLHLACAGLEALGIRRYRLVIGHVGVALQMLRQLGMSEHAQGLVLDLMEPLARGRVEPDAAVERLVGLLGGEGAASGDLSEGDEEPLVSSSALADLPPEQATLIAADILRRASLPLEGGARAPQAIIQRLLSKSSRPDPTAQVGAAIQFVLQLSATTGAGGDLGRLRALLRQHGLSAEPLDEVESALAMLRAYRSAEDTGEVEIEVDLSLARGLRYYTGLVFEGYVDTAEGPIQVFGGGRYDDLIRALGGRESVPACGFSFGLERVEMVLPPVTPPSLERPRVLVAGVGGVDHMVALRVASAIRTSVPQAVVEQDVRLRGPKAALRHADRTGAAVVVLVGERERAEGTVVLRDMQSREERRVPVAELGAALREALA